jgi:RNA polymerase sigma factor (sigma-70 family)
MAVRRVACSRCRPPSCSGTDLVPGRNATVNAEPARLTTEWLESPYLPRLISRVAHQHGLREEDLSDLLQETRIALWKAGAKNRVTGAWLFRTASHKAVDLVRIGIRHRAQDTLAARSPLPVPWPDVELEHLLHARVDQLPARLRKFYDLHYNQGLSERETAQSLGMCRASVRWLDRCCRRLISGRGELPQPGSPAAASAKSPEL